MGLKKVTSETQVVEPTQEELDAKAATELAEKEAAELAEKEAAEKQAAEKQAAENAVAESAAAQAAEAKKKAVETKKAEDKVKKAGSGGAVKKGCMLINTGKFSLRCPESLIVFLRGMPTLIEDKPTKFMVGQHKAGMLKIR